MNYWQLENIAEQRARIDKSIIDNKGNEISIWKYYFLALYIFMTKKEAILVDLAISFIGNLFCNLVLIVFLPTPPKIPPFV